MAYLRLVKQALGGAQTTTPVHYQDRLEEAPQRPSTSCKREEYVSRDIL